MLPTSTYSPRSTPLRLGVLISGGGTTLVNLHRQIQAGELNAEVPLVVASRECSGVQRCRALGLQVIVLPRKQYPDTSSYSEELFRLCREHQVDLVVLAGFLTRISIPEDYQLKVMNIHPALIPAFSGQGMFGHHVHEAVIARGCRFSGCTVHFCDNEYDHGPIISQRVVPVLQDDTPDALAARVFEEECKAYPEAISLFGAGRLKVAERRVFISDS
ncbi:phosphoribosylglycinamide formyltransferase [Planctomicrobium sp. SH661]|uniref:phosphoribosylglycinamide formyltransferase n=1 Tax=Planctomicrobium sp. SH661 TaxID=3448124 RepID=UPI003F5C2764